MIVNLLWAVVFRKVLKEIFVGELQPDETVDAMREAKLLSTVCVIFIVFYLWWVMRLSLKSLSNHFNEPNTLLKILCMWPADGTETFDHPPNFNLQSLNCHIKKILANNNYFNLPKSDPKPRLSWTTYACDLCAFLVSSNLRCAMQNHAEWPINWLACFLDTHSNLASWINNPGERLMIINLLYIYAVVQFCP